jgi:predicted ATP-dependent serine protease
MMKIKKITGKNFLHVSDETYSQWKDFERFESSEDKDIRYVKELLKIRPKLFILDSLTGSGSSPGSLGIYSGSMGSGKSMALMSAMMNMMNPSKNIITIDTENSDLSERFEKYNKKGEK